MLKTQIFYGLSAPDPAEKDRSLSAVSDSVGQMAHLTNQLLTLAKVEPDGSAVVLGPVDLVAVTRTVLEENADRALAKRIDLSFDIAEPLVLVHGSRALLHELVLNIVDNAIRYIPVGGSIAVEIAPAPDSAILRVKDDGPGIPAAERGRVFDRFYRILGSDTEGSGLGLSIVREIAARCGGSVRLANPLAGFPPIQWAGDMPNSSAPLLQQVPGCQASAGIVIDCHR